VRHETRKLNFAEVTAIGIGGMIGGGIFAVLGLAIAVAGNSVALTLAGGGAIALLTGFSYAHLGLTFRGDGGSFTYIERAFAAPSIAGIAGWLLIVGYIGTLALYATAFGDYGAALLRTVGTALSAGLLAGFVLTVFLFVNLVGAKFSGGVELGVVATKLGILVLFACAGAFGVRTSHFTPLFNHGWFTPVAAVALIFVAYEGFELIPNAINEMRDPERHLRPAILWAILVTTAIYVLVAIVALGNLTPNQIRHDQEYVLAIAAEPRLGHFGFVLIGVAALLSTASAINATLFGAARLAMVMAREHALPAIFSMRARARPIPYVALLVLTAAALAFTATANLAAISTLASATFLLIFTAVNLAAWRLSRRIGLHPAPPLAGALLTGGSCIALFWHAWANNRGDLGWIAAFYGAAAVVELVLIWRRGARRFGEMAEVPPVAETTPDR
jgi:amino acid transporter